MSRPLADLVRMASSYASEFDNNSSRTHTVIDVEAGGRTGRLYAIARAMTDADLDMASARIVTDAQRIRDSFYVSMNGAKIEEKESRVRIRDGIRSAIHQHSVL